MKKLKDRFKETLDLNYAEYNANKNIVIVFGIK